MKFDRVPYFEVGILIRRAGPKNVNHYRLGGSNPSEARPLVGEPGRGAAAAHAEGVVEDVLRRHVPATPQWQHGKYVLMLVRMKGAST